MYAQLVKLHTELAPRGFEILAFPCNQFLFQERGSNEEVCAFAAKKGASFPLFAKSKVNGADTNSVYQFLKHYFPGKIGWNFESFLVNREGVPVKRWDNSAKFEDWRQAIEPLLAEEKQEGAV